MQNRGVMIVVGGLFVLGGVGALLYFSQVPDKAPIAEPIVTAPPPKLTPTASPTATPKSVAPKPVEPTPTVEAAPTTGTLTFESDVPDTGVFLDRVFVGTAPVTARDVKPGPHTINLSATGYDGIVESIDVAPGPRTISVKFKEIRLNASIAVIHKHTIGSCTGTLKATPDGLTFDTANKGDAFTAPLTNLETWSLDYLAKSLRAKVKNGKAFSFTVAEEKADGLYAFHKEVENARQRLLKGK